MPLAHEGAELVGCEVQAVEVGEAVLALDFVDTELDLAESVVFVVLEIGERDLEDTALQGIVGVLQTGGSVDEGFSNTFRQLVCASFHEVLNFNGEHTLGSGKWKEPIQISI